MTAQNTTEKQTKELAEVGSSCGLFAVGDVVKAACRIEGQLCEDWPYQVFAYEGDLLEVRGLSKYGIGVAHQDRPKGESFRADAEELILVEANDLGELPPSKE